MKTLITVAIAATLTGTLTAQSTFRKSTNGSGFDQGYSVIHTRDGGLCVTGSSSSYGVGDDDVYIIKLDSNFNQQWAKVYDWGRHEIGLSAIETRDRNIVITGYTYKDIISDDQWDMFAMKIDSYGNVLWSKSIGGVKRENGNSITETSSGDILIAGSTTSYGNGLNDIYLVRLSQSGNIIWTKTLGGTTDDIAYSVCKTKTDGCIITGASNGFRPFIAKCDAGGNVIWSKTIAGGAASIGTYNSIACTKDGYVAAGYTRTSVSGNDILITRIDSFGNVIWSRTIGNNGDDNGNSIMLDRKGNYVVAGYANYGLIGSSENLYLVKLNPKGDVLWNRTISEQSDAVGRSITRWKGNGYLVAGSAWRNKDGILFKPDVYLANFDTSGTICGSSGSGYSPASITPYTADLLLNAGSGGTATDNLLTVFFGGVFGNNCASAIAVGAESSNVNQASAAKQLEVTVLPNPVVTGVLNLQITTDAEQPASLIITNMQGSTVFKQTMHLNAGRQPGKFNIAALPNGIYVLNITAGKNQKTVKFVKAN